MKVQFLVDVITDDSATASWRDMWIDSSKISGFFVADFDEEIGLCVDVLYDGLFLTFKQEEHLLDYLDKRFVKELVE